MPVALISRALLLRRSGYRVIATEFRGIRSRKSPLRCTLTMITFAHCDELPRLTAWYATNCSFDTVTSAEVATNYNSWVFHELLSKLLSRQRAWYDSTVCAISYFLYYVKGVDIFLIDSQEIAPLLRNRHKTIASMESIVTLFLSTFNTSFLNATLLKEVERITIRIILFKSYTVERITIRITLFKSYTFSSFAQLQ